VLKNSSVAYRWPGRGLVLLAFLGALVLAPARGFAETCTTHPTLLCLQGSRFSAEVTWTAPGFGSGVGQAVALTADTGFFWFFSNSNVELMVKVLDGRAVNQHFWVFFGGLSDVEYTLTITDFKTGFKEVFTNPRGRLASVSDVTAFLPEAPDGTGSRPVGASLSGGPARLGPEIALNVVPDPGNQVWPAVAVAPGGGFMAVWTREPIPTNGSAKVFGRLFDAAGNPRTGEIQLNTAPVGSGARARVAVSSSGEFMAVWSDRGGDAQGVQARLFGPDGRSLSGELTLNSDSGFVSAPDVTADLAGGFLVAWNEYSSAPGSGTLLAQRFNAQGGRIGPAATFSAQGSQEGPRLASSSGGGFLAVWAVVNPQVDAPVSDLWAQRLDALGRTTGGSFVINSETRPLPGGVDPGPPVFYGDGGFAVLWRQASRLGSAVDGLYARRYAADGTPASGIAALRSGIGVVESAPAAIALSNGETWVLWQEYGPVAAPGSNIYSGVFDPAWGLKGDVGRINVVTSTQGEVTPAVAATASGRIVAVWSDTPVTFFFDPIPPDLSGGSVLAQSFSVATCAVSSSQICLGDRFRVEVRFTDPRNGQTSSGVPVPLTGDTGAFWFFDPSNLELMIKVLDGRALNGHFWVFHGALSDVDYTITVTDTFTGSSRTYHNNQGHLASGSDVTAF
jgi:hypothetical protein